MTDTAADPRVDAYIDSLPEWQQSVCRKVRARIDPCFGPNPLTGVKRA
jgi:hypothetical protein